MVVGETLKAAPGKHVHVCNPSILFRAFPISGEISVRSDNWYSGSTAPLERLLLAQLVRFFKPRVILEIGTFRGNTTALLLKHAPKDARIYTIDLKAQAEKLGYFDYQCDPAVDRLTQIFGDTFDPQTWAHVPSNVEFAFIDAAHSYEAVKNDTEWVRRKLAPNGIILWHDYSASAGSATYAVGRYIREEMRKCEDIFVCAGTTLALSVPVHMLVQGEQTAKELFGPATFARNSPDWAFSWLRDSRSRTRELE
jgi:predicted O-methyltransferase YrrM